jgi:putative addiction module component (TIGR02574 family)
MPKTVPNPPPGFDDLTVGEQIEYVQALWEHIAASPDQVPVPEWHEKIIRERLEAYRANPTAGRTWSEVRTDIENTLKNR